jgi:hypothetical protein
LRVHGVILPRGTNRASKANTVREGGPGGKAYLIGLLAIAVRTSKESKHLARICFGGEVRVVKQIFFGNVLEEKNGK